MIITKKQSGIFTFFTTGKILLTAIVTSLLIITLSSCNQPDNTASKSHRSQQPVHRVEVVNVNYRAVSLTQTVSGTLEAVNKIRLYNEESGRITKLPYHEGDTVKKGTLLVQLDNELLKTDVAKARASKEQARVDLDRLQKLLPKKISTEEEVARARTQLDLAIAEEQYQLTRLARTSIRAPIDGLITRRFYEPGDMLTQHSHILSIIDPGDLKLEASLAERWIPLVNENQTVSLYIRALGVKAFPATISRIHPTIDPDTHKGIIEIQLDPIPDGARAGQFAHADIELKAMNRLIIPGHTIHFEPEGSYIYRVVEDDNGKTVAEKITIEQGQQFNSVTEILSGLKPGDRVVSRGYLGLRDGKEVEISNAKNSMTTSVDNGPETNKQ